MELFQCCPPSGKDKYPTWQYWQFPAKELLCLLVWGVGFHSHIINFYHTCIEHLWHIKQPLYKKKLQPSACIWVAPDLIADWKYLGKKPFVTRGEKYELIYFLDNVYKKESPLKMKTIYISSNYHFHITPISGCRTESQVNIVPRLWTPQGHLVWWHDGCS